MAYVTGSASSLEDLLASIRAACTANGYTLSGEILHKGTSYQRLWVASSALNIQGGNGKDGSNNLTTPGPQLSRIVSYPGAAALVFPATYHIHINTGPDEVYVFLNYSSLYIQWLAFGQSNTLSLAAGTGNWYGAHASATGATGISITSTTGGGQNTGSSGALFWQPTIGAINLNSFIHTGLDGFGWSGVGDHNVVGGCASAILAISVLIGSQPNLWNGEAVLLPIRVGVPRASSRNSIVAVLGHSRYLRNDNLELGQIITLGADQWKTYPWLKKDTTGRVGGTTLLHSGTFGIAVRHTP